MKIGREISRRLRIADEQLYRVRMGEAEIDPAVVSFHLTWRLRFCVENLILTFI